MTFTDSHILRAHIIDSAVRSIPREFLEDIHKRTAAAYLDVFHEVKLSKTTVQEQRSAKLLADRMFRMDWELLEAAKAHNMTATSKPLPENGWIYTYVVTGEFGVTQAYVPFMGALPQAAKYRDDLAMAANVPRLPLDEPEEIYKLRNFYGLLAHSPIGKRFEESHQKVGAVQLCVPYNDMQGWALEIGLPELLSHYPARPLRAPSKRGPEWKRPEDKRGKGAS